MGFGVSAHRFVDRGEERLFSEAGKQAEALQLVLYGIFHLGETQFDARSVQRIVKFTDDVGCGDIDTRDWFRYNHKPLHGCCGVGNRIQYASMEQFSIREEERCIPTEQYEAWD